MARKRRRQHGCVRHQQSANGWFANCDNTVKHNNRPITHTIAYTIDGLLQCGILLKDEALIASARRAADQLLLIFNASGNLNGRYDDRWHGSEHAITTGNAQLAVCWTRLSNITGDERYAQAALRMTEQLIAFQQLSDRGPVDAHGALPGSYPLWGRYEKFAFPNWATKYFIDALLCAEGHLPRF